MKTLKPLAPRWIENGNYHRLILAHIELGYVSKSSSAWGVFLPEDEGYSDKFFKTLEEAQSYLETIVYGDEQKVECKVPPKQ